jgi:predicted RNA-binding Zn ribbon-like protein
MQDDRQVSPAFDVPGGLSGGALCLGFVNTLGDRGRPETDRLCSYGDLLAFAAAAGLLTSAETASLVGRGERDPQAAAAAFALARDLREGLYRIFSAVAAARAPAAGDLAQLNSALPGTLSRLRLERRGHGFAWRWAVSAESLEAPLWPVVRAAADLLAGEERRQLRECAGSSCTWLFLDCSRNRSRRWCSMETCGNRAKARRHYHRRSRPAKPEEVAGREAAKNRE